MLEWYVCYTTAQGERLAKEDLEALGFQVFLPTRMEWHRVPRHRRKPGMPKRERIERLMFPRYLFVGLLPHWRDFPGIMRSKRIVEILADPYGNPKRLPERIVNDLMHIDQIKSAEARAQAAMRVAAWIGMRVKITDGPFKGAHGVVTRANRSGVRIEIMGLSGATFPLNVTLEQLPLLSIFIGQDDQQKRSAPQRASADPAGD